MKITIALLFALIPACAALGSEQGQAAQATAAEGAQEVSCQKFIARFRAGAADGLTCQESRKRAESEFTTCKLTFNCPRETWEAGPDVEGDAR